MGRLSDSKVLGSEGGGGLTEGFDSLRSGLAGGAEGLYAISAVLLGAVHGFVCGAHHVVNSGQMSGSGRDSDGDGNGSVAEHSAIGFAHGHWAGSICTTDHK